MKINIKKSKKNVFVVNQLIRNLSQQFCTEQLLLYINHKLNSCLKRLKKFIKQNQLQFESFRLRLLLNRPQLLRVALRLLVVEARVERLRLVLLLLPPFPHVVPRRRLVLLTLPLAQVEVGLRLGLPAEVLQPLLLVLKLRARLCERVAFF